MDIFLNDGQFCIFFSKLVRGFLTEWFLPHVSQDRYWPTVFRIVFLVKIFSEMVSHVSTEFCPFSTFWQFRNALQSANLWTWRWTSYKGIIFTPFIAWILPHTALNPLLSWSSGDRTFSEKLYFSEILETIRNTNTCVDTWSQSWGTMAEIIPLEKSESEYDYRVVGAWEPYPH